MSKRMALVGVVFGLSLARVASAAPVGPVAEGRDRPKSMDVKIRPEEVLIPVKRVNALAQGMGDARVRELLGQPSAVVTVPNQAVKTEVWTYRVAARDHTEQVATSMRDVIAYDPFANKMITVPEPVYQLLRTRTYTTLELLIVDGKLVERKGGREVERSYI